MKRLISLITNGFARTKSKRLVLGGPIALWGCIVMAGLATNTRGDDTADLAGIRQPTVTDKPSTIAGRNLAETIAETQSENRIARLRAIRSLRPFGDPAAGAFVDLLEHQDAAARYLAAEAIGDVSKPAMKPALDTLRRIARDDESLAVQMAAAYALCKAGETDDFLPVLIKRLKHPERGMVCSAAMLIGKIGPEASAAVEALQDVFENNKPKSPGDYHKGGAAKNALRKLGAVE